VESLSRMLGPDHLWPIDEYWTFHAGGDEFKDLKLFTSALEGRYGRATGVEDYARKAQALAYEGQRAMFEGYGRNKYTATGVIQWMLNNAWPSMIWHLYDYYLRPGGSYFGAKKAGEPLHVQFGYDDRSVVVVNSTLKGHVGLKATARVLDLASKELFARTAPVDVGPDGSAKAFRVPEPPGLTPTYFIALTLDDAAGRTVSRNVYWLSTKRDVLAWDKSEWYYTPLTEYADLTGLQRLPPAEVEATATGPTAAASPASTRRLPGRISPEARVNRHVPGRSPSTSTASRRFRPGRAGRARSDRPAPGNTTSAPLAIS